MKFMRQCLKNLHEVPHAKASLGFGLAMGVVTTVHHLHSALFLHPESSSMHVVWNEMVLLPTVLVTMFVYLHNQSRIALWIYLTIAFAGFVGLGLYEGGWNHTLGLLAHMRIDLPETRLSVLLPANDPHRWFYELSGVATFLIAMLASYFSWAFARAIMFHKSTTVVRQS